MKHIFIEILISRTAAAGNDESAPPLLRSLTKKRAQAAWRLVMTLLCFNIAIFLAKLLGAEQVRNLGFASLVLLRNPFDIHSIVLFCSEVRKAGRLVTHRKKGNR